MNEPSDELVEDFAEALLRMRRLLPPNQRTAVFEAAVARARRKLASNLSGLSRPVPIPRVDDPKPGRR